MKSIDKVIEYNTIIRDKLPTKVIFFKHPEEKQENFDFYFKEICHWLTFIIPYSNLKMKKFTLIIHLSREKKVLPKKLSGLL